MDETFPTSADFKKTLSQFSALTTFMFVDGKSVLPLLSDACKDEQPTSQRHVFAPWRCRNLAL